MHVLLHENPQQSKGHFLVEGENLCFQFLFKHAAQFGPELSRQGWSYQGTEFLPERNNNSNDSLQIDSLEVHFMSLTDEMVDLLQKLDLLVDTLQVLSIVESNGNSEERQVTHILVDLLHCVLESEGRTAHSVQIEVDHHVVVFLEAVGFEGVFQDLIDFLDVLYLLQLLLGFDFHL